MAARSLEAVLAQAEALHRDLDLAAVKEWKAEGTGRRAIGYLPVYAPVDVVTGAGMLPVGIVGGGDQVEIIRGDAYFQSYICHLPRSVVELGVSGRLDACDGFLFPSTCDVIRNLSGAFQVLFPEKYVRYIDVPQDFSPGLGGVWWRSELARLRADLERIGGRKVTDDDLWGGILAHDAARAALRRLYDFRSQTPHLAPTTEVYLVQRAGLLLPPEQHASLIEDYIAAARLSGRPERDQVRFVLAGAFCEQPPIKLLTTLERAGCHVVDDDLLLGPRYLLESVCPEGGPAGDPLDALVAAFLTKGTATAFIYCEKGDKGAELVRTVCERQAEGVVFCAPSFCDPALLDRPMLATALDKAGISHTSFKYAENMGQFQTIREQTGTFADSLKLWGEA